MKTYTDAGLATVLRAEELPRHRELPDGWKRTMGWIVDHGGPWECPSPRCRGPSYLFWRCSVCGADRLK